MSKTCVEQLDDTIKLNRKNQLLAINRNNTTNSPKSNKIQNVNVIKKAYVHNIKKNQQTYQKNVNSASNSKTSNGHDFDFKMQVTVKDIKKVKQQFTSPSSIPHLSSKHRQYTKPPPIVGHTKIPIYFIHHKPINHKNFNNCDLRNYTELSMKPSYSQCPLCKTEIIPKPVTNNTLELSSKKQTNAELASSFSPEITPLTEPSIKNIVNGTNSNSTINNQLTEASNQLVSSSSLPSTPTLPAPTPPPPPPPPPLNYLNKGDDYSKLMKLNWNKFDPDSPVSIKSIWSELDRIKIDENKIKELFTVNKDGIHNYVRLEKSFKNSNMFCIIYYFVIAYKI